MSNPVVTVSPETTVKQAAEILRKHDIGLLVVTDESGKVVGVVSERDLVDVVASGKPFDTPVREIMRSPVISVSPDDAMYKAAKLMSEYKIRHIVVIDPDGKPVGVVSIRDVLRAVQGLIKLVAEEIEALIKS